MTDTTTCECSDEYGPCEAHGTVLAHREGASLHTADELSRILIDDLLACGAELSPYDTDVITRVDAAMSEDRWIEDADLAQELHDLTDQVESYVADLWVIHDDGYRIVRPHADCPLF